MEYRELGKTGLRLSVLSFGAASLGEEYRRIDLNEAMRSVRVALDIGMNFIDTSHFYGRGTSEALLGFALRGIPRDRYVLGTKLGRYDTDKFDFSARRVAESVDVSLRRMGVEHLDICLCHDIEFVEMSWIVEETLPALRKIQREGKVRFVGVSGYPMKIFKYILDRTELDVILSYNHYTLQNTQLGDLAPYLKNKGVGIMNAAPFAGRLLTDGPLPTGYRFSPEVQAVCRKAAEYCRSKGVDFSQLALQFSIRNPDFATCIAGSANPERIARWGEWVGKPIDDGLLHEIQEILKPIHNWVYIEGRPENNGDN